MKTIKFICACFLVTSSLFLTSCSKDDDGGGGGNAAAGTITGKVNGTTVTSSSQLTQANKVTAGSTSSLTMQGTNFDGKGFSFVINNFTGTGTYEIGGSSSVFVVASYIEGNASNPLATNIWSAPFDTDAVRGEISFSEATDDNVKGTFSFTAKNPNDDTEREITQGAFNVGVTNF
jgi:hypothetical protein